MFGKPAIARRMPATAIDCTSTIPSCLLEKLIQRPRRLLLLGNLRAVPLLLLPQLGSERGAEVRRLEDLANLDLGVLERSALEPLDRLFFRPHLPQPEPGDELLRLGEGAVDDGPLPLGELDARALRARLESLAREHHPRLHPLFVELPLAGTS